MNIMLEHLESAQFQKVEAFFKHLNTPNSPGCVFAIIHKGNMVYQKSYGMADLEHDVPITPQSVFFLGSISKQFTAMCILLLVEQNLITLDDDIRKYFPHFPDYGSTITIRHLIHHTSGIRDYCGLVKAAGMNPTEMTNLSMQDVLHVVFKQKELNFLPGESQRYCNSGYVMLAALIEKVTGKSLREYAHQHIFNPLGMTHTSFIDDNKYLINNRANGYLSDGNQGYYNTTVNHKHCGPGGAYSTIDDLFLWDQNFYRNQLGKKDQDLIKTMQTPFILNNGVENNYAFGLSIHQYKGLQWIFHGGGFPGYNAFYYIYPQYQFSMIMLANHPQTIPAMKIADIFLNPYYVPAPPEITIAPAIYRNYVGQYYSEFFGRVSISRNKQDLSIHFSFLLFGGKLTPLSETSFSLEFPNSTWITFQKEDYSEFSFYFWGNASQVKRFGAFKLEIETLDDYCGKYYSEEIDRTYYLLRTQNKLIIEQNSFNLLNCEMVPAEKDLFLTENEVFRFKRFKTGKIAGFSLNRPLVRNLWFSRIESL